MARIKDIVETEKFRSDMAEGRIIHLYVEGTFCHAYEWSAWLWQRFVREFKVTHTLFKDIEESVALIGCPLANLQVNVPEGANLIQKEDKLYDLILPESMLPNNYDTGLMLKDFLAWKQSLPEAKESNSRKKTQINLQQKVSNSSFHLTDIMRDIVSFDVNRHTPFECMEFLSDIKQQLISII